MKKEEIYSMTNDYGKKFFNDWLQSKEILGVERTESNIGRKEFTVIYRYSDGKINAAILPDVGTNDNGSCFFGDLKHFAMCYAEGKANVNLRLNNNGNLMWPVWYLSENIFELWHRYYKEMIEKYS